MPGQAIRQISPDAIKSENKRSKARGGDGKKKAAATINREIGGLKQAFNRSRKHGRLSRVPYFPVMREDNAPQGFFEHTDFERVVAELPDRSTRLLDSPISLDGGAAKLCLSDGMRLTGQRVR